LEKTTIDGMRASVPVTEGEKNNRKGKELGFKKIEKSRATIMDNSGGGGGGNKIIRTPVGGGTLSTN